MVCEQLIALFEFTLDIIWVIYIDSNLEGKKTFSSK